MKCVDISRIQEITTTQLIYTDDSGERIAIDLNACVKQYAIEFEAERGKPYPKDGRCVGDRWILRYFELYTTPEHTRFTMTLKPLNRFQRLLERMHFINFYIKEREQFHKIQRRFMEVGFRTFDLT